MVFLLIFLKNNIAKINFVFVIIKELYYYLQIIVSKIIITTKND